MSIQQSAVGVVTQGPYTLIGRKDPQAPDSSAGLWQLPGGLLEPHESSVQGVIRETKEETNIEVLVNKLLKVQPSKKGKIVYWYACTPISYDVRAGSDLVAVRYVPTKEVAHHCQELYKHWPAEVKTYLQQTLKQHAHHHV